MHKVIVAGSRLMFQYNIVEKVLDEVFKEHSDIEIVSGNAKGADSLGELYAAKKNIKLAKFPADWKAHGKAAGAIRNREMAEYADSCIVFWDGISRGSKNMIETATKLGLKTLVYNYITGTKKFL